MPKKIDNIQIPLGESLEEKLQLLSPDWSDYRILRKSIDARKRRQLQFIYSVEVAGPGETLSEPLFCLEKIKTNERPIIIGAGPAGLFAALRFVERGVPCTLIERGSQAEKRLFAINRFWRSGELDPDNNIYFGEGGAGLYSDGKLITRIKSPHIPYVMNRLVQFGAPKEIQYLANPHVGSDRLRRVIPHLRQFLIQNGCQIHFDTEITDFLTHTSTTPRHVTGVKSKKGDVFYAHHIILATGTAARPLYENLQNLGAEIKNKSFAMGFRIEHQQSAINKIQYRQHAEHPELEAANYKLTHHDHSTGLGVFSFCMCPGGYVLSCGTEPDGVVCNGMSNYKRNSGYANSAVVITIDHEKNFTKTWDGYNLTRHIEKSAWNMTKKHGASKQLPAQIVSEFFSGKATDILPHSSPSGCVPARLDQLFNDTLTGQIKEALEKFNQKMPGFVSNKALLYGVESRTSSSIQICRDKESLESTTLKGIYPSGEGAGYAGGITSAACDGIRIAEKIITQLQ